MPSFAQLTIEPDGAAVGKARPVVAKPDARLARPQHERHAVVHGRDARVGLSRHNGEAPVLPHTRDEEDAVSR